MISVIIPTYNEASHIQETIRQLWEKDQYNLVKEVIVSDGASRDNTGTLANSEGVKIVISPRKGRAAQMNFGACYAKEEILYFLHADSLLPDNFTSYILKAYKKKAISGCFRLAFDYNHWFLKANCWFTRFDLNAVRFGDQSLFITKDVFHSCGGFREDLLIMEDQEIIHRIKKHGKFIVMPAAIITSARKYLDNGIYRMQRIFFLIWFLYYLGFSQEYLVKLHRKLIRNNKL